MHVHHAAVARDAEQAVVPPRPVSLRVASLHEGMPYRFLQAVPAPNNLNERVQDETVPAMFMCAVGVFMLCARPGTSALARKVPDEFLHEDTPKKVVINEALEITKKFSTPEAVQFINGILDAVRLELEAQ